MRFDELDLEDAVLDGLYAMNFHFFFNDLTCESFKIQCFSP